MPRPTNVVPMALARFARGPLLSQLSAGRTGVCDTRPVCYLKYTISGLTVEPTGGATTKVVPSLS